MPVRMSENTNRLKSTQCVEEQFIKPLTLTVVGSSCLLVFSPPPHTHTKGQEGQRLFSGYVLLV